MVRAHGETTTANGIRDIGRKKLAGEEEGRVAVVLPFLGLMLRRWTERLSVAGALGLQAALTASEEKRQLIKRAERRGSGRQASAD